VNVDATLQPGQMLVPPTALTLNTRFLDLDRKWDAAYAERILRDFDILIDPQGNVCEGNVAVQAALFLNMERVIVTVYEDERYNLGSYNQPGS
jgi:hypothetical protein